MSMKKVIILTEGGKGIGLGHITRCSALYEAFKEKDIPARFIANADRTVKKILEDKESEIFNWLKDRSRLFGLISGADIVVVDSYLAEGGLYKKIADRVRTTVYIDDNNRIRYPRGIVVNGSIYAGNINYPKASGIEYMLGVKYFPIRKEFRKIPGKKINEKIKNVLVTFGGSQSGDLIDRVTRFFRRNPGLNVYAAGCRGNIFSARQLLHLMLKADICISGGGQTTYELARVGVPTIGVCLAENQRMNLEGWEEAGFLEYAGWHNDKNLINRISGSFGKMQPYPKRVYLSKAGRGRVDGIGAERVVHALQKKIFSRDEDLGYAIRLRDAVKDDCYDVWLWRNCPEVRRACYDTDPIRYSEHCGWFNDRVNDPGFFIAEDGNGHKVGQARFEKNGKGSAYINVNLNPDYFGKGFGSRVINKSTEYFMNRKPDIKNITAKILYGNIGSQKAFEKAGYKFYDCAVLDGKKTLIYKFNRTQGK